MREKYICTNCGSIFEENEAFENKKPKYKITAFGCFFGFLLFCLIGFTLLIILAVPEYDIARKITGILFFLFILSGLIGSTINNVFSWYNSPFCPYCMNNNCIIPINTPKGQELYNKYHIKK